jgi:hypothetical protein
MNAFRDTRSDKSKMNPTVHFVVLVTAVGKAAVGGAGLSLALLGMLNAALDALNTVISTPGHDFLDATSLFVPAGAAAGAVAAAAYKIARIKQGEDA